MDICDKFSIIEERGNQIVDELNIQALRQQADARECEVLAKELTRHLHRWRRSTNLSIETVQALQLQLEKEESLNRRVAYKLKKMEDQAKAFQTENINVNAAIVQLEQTLDIS